MVKIGIVGTYYSGKDTFKELLIRALSKDFQVENVSDPLVQAKAYGWPVNRDQSFEGAVWCIARGIQLEMEGEKDSHIIVTGQPLISLLAGLFAALECRGEKLDKWQEKFLFETVKTYSISYNLIFHAKFDDLVGTGMKGFDEQYRKCVAKYITEILHQMELTATDLTYGNRATLLSYAVNSVEKLLNSEVWNAD